MEKQYDRKLILEDGEVYPGHGFGGTGCVICDIVFNSSMIGYQEIISDPTYTDCAVVMTYPLIGSYGITDEDFESRYPSVGALIVGEYNDKPSNFRCTKTLAEILEEYNIPGIEIDDTRRLTRSIRDKGSRRAILCDASVTVEEALARMAETPVPHDAVARVSCKKRWYARTPDHKYDVVVLDLGVRQSIIRSLHARDCNVTVVPWNTTPEVILSMKPDGLLISGGPGNPEDIAELTETVAVLRGKLPIFGIGLGCQLIAMTYGATTYRLKAGHHGSNHPIRTLATDKVETLSQNHNYAICADALANTTLTVTHVNILDNTVEGIANPSDRVLGVQFHPVSNVAPEGNVNPFDRFISMMQED